MLNKLQSFIRKNRLVSPGDRIVCAVSGGADSVALLFAFYLLKEKLQISLCAAHFNHHLRGEESERDEAFVREFCEQYDIELYVGEGTVTAGKKGLEAAARDARYAFLKGLSGKIATAHTADDNAETVLMHLVRGTGLKGLGGIAPINGVYIRPMLQITRQEVLEFIRQYGLSHVEDSSNQTDQFLRNRIRHHIMPLLKQENPRISGNLSDMAMRLRKDEQLLSDLAASCASSEIEKLRQMPEALRVRALANFLQNCGIAEPDAQHLSLAESLVFSDKPSARVNLPGGVVIARNYDKLEKAADATSFSERELPCPGSVEIPEIGLEISCVAATNFQNSTSCFTVRPAGKLLVRMRRAGDSMELPFGRKSLKKLFIDKKIPSAQRTGIAVVADDLGVVGVYGFGASVERLATELPAYTITLKEIN